jgi:S-DNA-T family DNA segregation ATPase FtsK/SpoIIIE
VDVVTGLIKGNLPARIAFQVASRSDSRVVLDEMGADKLLGNGDMLFLFPGTSHIVRAQGTYVSDAEINRVCHYLEQYPIEFSRELVQLQVSGGPGGKDRAAALKERDELYEPAIEIIIREGRGSCSLLQRALGIGYGRAARLIDFMAEDGIVGEFKSGSAREVLYTWDEWEALKAGGDSSPSAA